MKSTVLITGAYGFIGTNISSQLRNLAGYSLIALDILESRKDGYAAHYTWKELDAIDWNRIDVVIHLAGKAHDTSNADDSQSYFDVNYGLTKMVFERFLRSTAKKFIFFSSVKAVADTVSGECLTEATIPNPQTPYGKSKLQAEQFIQQQALPPGKQVYILRPSMIHGPGNKGNLNLLYTWTHKGLPWPLGAFDNIRSFTSINNLLFVIRQLIEKEIECGTYQIADDEPLSTNELIRLIADSICKKTYIMNISPIAIKLMAKAGDMFQLPLNSERLKKLTESYVVCNQKLKNALGVKKMPYTAVDGMKSTLEYFKNKINS